MSRRREDYRGGDAPQGKPDTVPPGSYFGSVPGAMSIPEVAGIECSSLKEGKVIRSDDFDGFTIFNVEGWRIPVPIEGEKLEAAYIDEAVEMTDAEWKRLGGLTKGK